MYGIQQVPVLIYFFSKCPLVSRLFFFSLIIYRSISTMYQNQFFSVYTTNWDGEHYLWYCLNKSTLLLMFSEPRTLGRWLSYLQTTSTPWLRPVSLFIAMCICLQSLPPNERPNYHPIRPTRIPLGSTTNSVPSPDSTCKRGLFSQTSKSNTQSCFHLCNAVYEPWIW